MDANTRALTNRSIRTIQTELDFLVDCNLLTPQQLSTIQNNLPSPSSNPRSTHSNNVSSPPPPTSLLSNMHLSEKQSHVPSPQPSPAPLPLYSPPPAQTVASATSLYVYHPSDAGDLALQPQDRISITEFMNADWAKGRNERTGQEGIFPRSYVSITDDKGSGGMPPPPPSNGTNYGNLPLTVSQGGGVQQQQPGNGKLEQTGKKFGKKLGNAAIFGAGASIGSNIVNGIF